MASSPATCPSVLKYKAYQLKYSPAYILHIIRIANY
jgi:hypothetical protein